MRAVHEVLIALAQRRVVVCKAPWLIINQRLIFEEPSYYVTVFHDPITIQTKRFPEQPHCYFINTWVCSKTMMVSKLIKKDTNFTKMKAIKVVLHIIFLDIRRDALICRRIYIFN